MNPQKMIFQMLLILFMEIIIIFPVYCNLHLRVGSHRDEQRTITDNIPAFWRSTGFCPSKPHSDSFKYDISPDMIQNLAYIGSIPFSGMQQVRIHWLLDLVRIKKKNLKPVYDFSWLDELVDQLYTSGLFPGFELMGSLHNFFNDFENRTQLFLWKDLVKRTAQRYIRKYGLHYVKNWNFETWNEPDCHDFDAVNMTVTGFLNYYDACSEGLKAADKSLKFGGPGDGCYYKRNHKGHKKYANALLSHVINGTNYFTRERGVRIDFLSWHLKGEGKAQHILELERQLDAEIKMKYPTLSQKPFYNDEADPLVGWSKPRTWRADVNYAALVVKVISQHQIARDSLSLNYSLLSNDNAFLSYYPHQFTQRSLLARFQMNNTNPPHVQFIRKPVHTAMVMLAYLGEQMLDINITNNVFSKSKNVGGLATKHLPDKSIPSDSFQMSILLFNSTDPGPDLDSDKNEQRNQTNDHGLSVRIYVSVPPTSSKDLQMIVYQINNSRGNPYDVWKKMRKPDFPSKEQFHEIRKQEGLQVLHHVAVRAGVVELPISNFSAPSLLLVHICSKALSPPGQVISVTVLNITRNQVLLVWSDRIIGSKCLLTYEVQFSPNDSSSDYKRINNLNSTVTAFVFAPIAGQFTGIESVRGYYRVKAVDYWHRSGHFSSPFHYS